MVCVCERRALEKRWRVERRLSVPSDGIRFHEVDEPSKREPPYLHGAMKGLR